MDEAQRLLIQFEEELKHKNRFHIKSETTQLFERITKDFTEVIPNGSSLFRGRINPNNNLEPYSDKEIGMPNPKDKISVGRANPYGINYLYLSEDIDTVIAEIRPIRHSLVTIGKFQVLHDIKVVKLPDITVHSDETICYLAFLLGMRFSQPVNGNSNEMDYLTTQYFAELCKYKGYDGIKFLSSVMNNDEHPHYNVTLFYDHYTKCVSKRVCSVININYEYQFI